MRIWIKTLIAITLALLAGLLIPLEWDGVVSFFNLFSTLSLNIGRYILFPLIFFSLVIRSFDLHRKRKLGKTVGFSWILIFITTLLFSIIGTVATFLLENMPINRQIENSPLEIPSFQDLLLNIFPENLFSIFLQDGNFLIPIVFFALFFGWNLSFDKITTRPIADLFDSLSKTFFHINIFFAEVSGFGIFFIMTSQLLTLRGPQTAGHLNYFQNFFMLLVILTVLIIFAFYPLMLFLFGRQKNPYRVLFGILTPLVAAFVSGDLFYSTLLSFQHNEKNLGVKHPINVTTTSITAVAGRAGTALITSASVVFLMKSYYSSASIGFFSILFVILLSFTFSFFTGAFHRDGIIVSVALIFIVLQKKGNEYMNLIVIAPFLYSFAALIDSVNNSVITFIVGERIEKNRTIPVKDYI